jgi:hypothetical protein
MIARSLASFILTIAVLSLGGCQTPQSGPARQGLNNANDDRGSLGYLEHRGRRHALLDLLDPAYRAGSDDPVARNFNLADYSARRLPPRAHVDLPE